jgi:hypothetical protein
LPVRFPDREVKSNGELLVAGACADGFLVTSWLLATPRRVERFVAFFFAGSAASYMSIQVVLCRLHAATGVRFTAYALEDDMPRTVEASGSRALFSSWIAMLHFFSRSS